MVPTQFLLGLEHIPRKLFALGSWVVILVLSQVLTTWLGMSLPFGLAVWALIMAFSVRPFMVSVPEYATLVTINLLKKDIEALKEYPTGLHFRYPWEQVKEGNYINLRLLPLGGAENYPANDGPMMHAVWQAPYRVINAIKYIGVGREAVEDILKKAGSGVLSAHIARRDSDKLKKGQANAEKALQKKFAEMALENLCGVMIPVVSLADFDYEEAVQRVRATQYVAKKVKQISQDLREGQTEIHPKDSLNAAMIIHGDVKKNVFEVEGIAPVVDAILKTFGSKK